MLVKTAQEMRRISNKYKYNNDRINDLFLYLNSQIKDAAKDGRYSISSLINIHNMDEAEYIKQYYAYLGYGVKINCILREIYISWEEKPNEQQMD